MTRRIDIPLVVDILLVDDPEQMRVLNDHPLISRRLAASSRLLNTLTRRKLEKLRVGDQPLPVFVPREDAESRRLQHELAERLDTAARAGLPAVHAEVRALGAYVAGERDLDVGVTVQRAVGRLFRPDYESSCESYAAACVIDEWPKPNLVKSIRLAWTGRLKRSMALLWRLGREEPRCIHSTAIAMHNVVATVRDMRAGFARSERTRGLPPARAVATYLHAPARLVRSCTGELRVDGIKAPLHAGTLVLFELGKVLITTGKPEYAFAAGEWNACPGAGATITLLELVWQEAQRLVGRGDSGPPSEATMGRS